MGATPADSDAWFDEQFTTSPVMAILRGLGVDRTVELAERAWQAGVGLVEVPIQSDEDVESLRKLAGRSDAHPVGAGTVLTVDQVEVAQAAGAQFIVSPGLDRDVVRASLARGLAVLPGVATPTEVSQALTLGLHWLKMFPASVIGPEWLGAMRGPFPRVRFVATGGIDATNAAAFLRAGAGAVALGSALADEQQLGEVLRLRRPDDG